MRVNQSVASIYCYLERNKLLFELIDQFLAINGYLEIVYNMLLCFSWRIGSFPILQGQDVYSISVSSKDDDDAHFASPPAFLSILEVPNQSQGPVCLDAHLNCQDCIGFQMKRDEVYSPCIIDVPSGNENSFSPESYEDGVESLKTDNLLAVSRISNLWTCFLLRYHMTDSLG